MLGSGLLRDGTSTEKESRVSAVAGTWQATCTSHKIVVELLDGLCVFESWRKERKRASVNERVSE